MKLIRSLLIFAVVILCFFPAIISAQVSGTTYKLSAGQISGGGGSSSSANYNLTGVAPLVGAASLSSGSYSLISGSTGITYGGMTTLKTTYTGNNVATVPKTAQNLKIAYSGSSGDAVGTIYYRQSGSSSYQTAAMTAGTGDTLIYNLSADLLTITGLEYYLEVTRGIYLSRVGSAANPLVFRVSLTNEQAQNPIETEPQKYRIIGVPININGSNSVASVFEDDLGTYNTSQWRLGRYNTASEVVEEFSSADPVVPGRGYWLITATPQDFGAAGVSIRPNRLERFLGNTRKGLSDELWWVRSRPPQFDTEPNRVYSVRQRSRIETRNAV